MNNHDLLDAAELALAGYGQFLSVGTPSIARLKVLNEDLAGFAESQAKKFSERFRLPIPTYNDATRPLSDEDRRLGISQTSFDVSVFQGQTGSIKDQIYLAIRGTQQKKVDIPSDLSANAEILLGHGAASQIVAMVNWWWRVSATKESLVPQYHIETRSDPSSPPAGAVLLSRVSDHPPLWDYLVQTAKVLSTGELADALQTSGGVTVTGSSMGGHLAMAFAALFGGQVKQAVAFNAPGFPDNEYLRNLFTGLGGTLPRVGDAKILNVVSSEEADPADDLNVVAGFPDGNFPGRKLLLPIEDQTFSDVPDPKTPSGNHDQRIHDEQKVSISVDQVLLDARRTGVGDRSMSLRQSMKVIAELRN